jgi:hypothetical protein
MMAGKYFVIISIWTAIFLPSVVPAQVDTRRIKQQVEASRVIEEKCLICHNRQLIDEAIKEKQEMDQVLRRMEKKGVVLTGKERRVMGHFWDQKLFRSEKTDGMPSH